MRTNLAMIRRDELLTEENFQMFAMKAYENPQCLSWDEFVDDLKKVKYIKRLLNRYLVTGHLKERLVLNHIVVLANVFGVSNATKMLFFKLEDELHPLLKTFLAYLSYMPDMVEGAREYVIYNEDIPRIPHVAEILRNL